MRALLAGALLMATVACGGRKVDVETAPKATAAAVTLHFTNNDNSAVNVYVVNNGTDHFLKQVPAKQPISVRFSPKRCAMAAAGRTPATLPAVNALANIPSASSLYPRSNK